MRYKQYESASNALESEYQTLVQKCRTFAQEKNKYACSFVVTQYLSSLHSLYAFVALRLEEEQRTMRDLLAAVEAERDAAVSELKVRNTFRIAM